MSGTLGRLLNEAQIPVEDREALLWHLKCLPHEARATALGALLVQAQPERWMSVDPADPHAYDPTGETANAMDAPEGTLVGSPGVPPIIYRVSHPDGKTVLTNIATGESHEIGSENEAPIYALTDKAALDADDAVERATH